MLTTQLLVAGTYSCSNGGVPRRVKDAGGRYVDCCRGYNSGKGCHKIECITQPNNRAAAPPELAQCDAYTRRSPYQGEALALMRVCDARPDCGGLLLGC